MGDKALIASKTVWANAVVAAIIAGLGQFGIVLTADQTALAYTALNVVMRWISSGAITGIVKPA